MECGVTVEATFDEETGALTCQWDPWPFDDLEHA